MSPPNLFTLPRECRDLIYSYLTHDIVLDWGYRMYPFPLGGHSAVQIRVPNAPIVNVLLSCTQIYDEYRQARHFKNPCMSINLSEHCLWRLMEGEPTNQARVFEILERIARVEFSAGSAATLSSTLEAGGLQDLWMLTETLMQTISVFAPKLTSVGMALRISTTRDRHGIMVEDEVRTDLAVAESWWTHQLPPIVAGRFILDGRELGLKRVPLPCELFWGTRNTEHERTALLKAEWCLPATEKIPFS